MASDKEEQCPKCGGAVQMTGYVNRSSSPTEYAWGICHNCREEIIIAINVESGETRDDLIL